MATVGVKGLIPAHVFTCTVTSMAFTYIHT